jgi:hypothetical protein
MVILTETIKLKNNNNIIKLNIINVNVSILLLLSVGSMQIVEKKHELQRIVS